jgi:Ser/Thr protein kinase RdoA (MazF antagonist)
MGKLIREDGLVTSVILKAAEAFELGETRVARRVPGGLSNELWRVDASGGAFAVKVMQVNAERPDFRDNVEAAFAIELNAFQQGVPCPEPWPSPDGGGLLRVEGRWVRVHRWCDGGAPTATNHLEEAGRLLSRIHQAAPQHDDADQQADGELEGDVIRQPHGACDRSYCGGCCSPRSGLRRRLEIE